MKTIKLLTLILFCSLVLQTTFSLAGSRQTRKVDGFHGVSVSSGIDLYLTQKTTEEVIVEAETDDLDKIITQVEGGILKIYIKEKSWFNFGWDNHPRKVYVSFKELDKIEASAGSDVAGQSVLKFNQLDVNASSGSDIKLELEANEVSISSSSGSDVMLKGKTVELHADASSGSDIQAGELHSKNCRASVSSGSDIRVYATGRLDANASSGGDIVYYGNPSEKEINESSGGDVHGR
jgi:hypothetical protein